MQPDRHFERYGLITSVEAHWSTFRSGSCLGISLVVQTSRQTLGLSLAALFQSSGTYGLFLQNGNFWQETASQMIAVELRGVMA